MFRLTSQGSWNRTEEWLGRLLDKDLFRALDHYGEMGVAALRAATPVDSGITAASWDYEITHNWGSGYQITWVNRERAGGVLVLMLHYGHGTGTGGYVAGRDFIRPAIAPIFDKIAQDAAEAVMKA